MEKLTFASLAHLPTAVIFVIDPTGLSGEKSTLLAQLSVRKHLKERFPRRPWLDVVSKGAAVLSLCNYLMITYVEDKIVRTLYVSLYLSFSLV